MNKDFFGHKAKIYEQDKNRVENVENIAKTLLSNVQLSKDMHIMDFGSGTGLLLEKVAPFVKKITAVDISPSMNKQLDEKRSLLECELEILELDLAKTKLNRKFDGIISSMTMHHVEDVKSMFSDFYDMLNDDGIIVIADLEPEDGTFHTEDTGIFHLGFDTEEISGIARSVGFTDVKTMRASVAKKTYGKFPIFLLTGKK